MSQLILMLVTQLQEVLLGLLGLHSQGLHLQHQNPSLTVHHQQISLQALALTKYFQIDDFPPPFTIVCVYSFGHNTPVSHHEVRHLVSSFEAFYDVTIHLNLIQRAVSIF